MGIGLAFPAIWRVTSDANIFGTIADDEIEDFLWDWTTKLTIYEGASEPST
jgi:hypothetical protein